MGETSGRCRAILAAALAESYLLAGRIDFIDLQQPQAAGNAFVRGLQAAGEADDALLGAAILAHTAFIPGWAGQREDAEERMSAARAYARRGNAPALMLAWLDAVEAECMTRCNDTRTALCLIAHPCPPGGCRCPAGHPRKGSPRPSRGPHPLRGRRTPDRVWTRPSRQTWR